MTDASMSLTLAARAEIAPGIHVFELRRADGLDLPAFHAGAHIQVHTPAGIMRRYSLCNAPSERHRYVLGIKREPTGGGGSVSMVDQLAIGDTITVSAPANDFPLANNADSHLLIAGGIGITPILAMARQLQTANADFRVIYCARTAASAAFLDVWAEPCFADRVTLHFDDGDPARAFDFASHLQALPAGQHVYCCGPRPLMQAVREAGRHLPSGTLHFEDFGTSAKQDASFEQGFRVRLARSGSVVVVPPGLSILEALRRNGVTVPSSCEAGTCGSCRVTLLEGQADHRDFVLDDDEQDTAIMICVSRAISEELVIDA